MIPVELKILDPRLGTEFPLPDYATPAAAGVDLRAMLETPLTLAAGQSELVATGIAIYIGDPGWCGIILPRSGLGHRQGLVLGNLVGMIDADYQGPLMMSLWNRSAQALTIMPGDRVAQLVLMPVGRARFIQVTQFDRTERGEGGFGHTGLK